LVCYTSSTMFCLRYPQVTTSANLMRLMSARMTNRQIATRLSISEGTVRTHCENIFRQLDVNNRVAAVAKALSGDR
ncbi:MAG TPA: LuxR C-terminal-related transcriptional regulator, partial [Kineosporiaceae bacterium]|nr:LuxR C-terminal-related transcriptional regulator [Kineosporiaceae bacterium]